MAWRATHLSIPIDREVGEVAAFAGDPANLARWAAGLGGGIREAGGRWFAEMEAGTVEVRFVGPVGAGVLDHEVTLPDGQVVYNPFRVLPNDGGSEVVFTVFQLPGVTDEAYDADLEAVRRDLAALKGLLED